jgi:hypothetical protein
MARVRYFKVKRSGEILVGNLKYSAYMLGGMYELSRHDMMQDANRCVDIIFMFLMFC